MRDMGFIVNLKTGPHEIKLATRVDRATTATEASSVRDCWG